MLTCHSFVYVHGAGGRGSDFDLVAEHLRASGHESIAPDLPCDQEVGLDAYVATVVGAVATAGGDARDDLVTVGQSLGGLTAPIVAAKVDARLLVLLAAMVPRPGESGGEWWSATGHDAAVAAQGLADDRPETVLTNEVPADVLAASIPPRDQTSRIMQDPWPLAAWPDVPTRALVCRQDRFFPAPWLSQVVRDRLGIEPDLIEGDHCAYLSRPAELATTLDRCWRDVAR
jgi:alpha-beta hydrolase superfamily lysophospholipase